MSCRLSAVMNKMEMGNRVKSKPLATAFYLSALRGCNHPDHQRNKELSQGSAFGIFTIYILLISTHPFIAFAILILS